MPAAQVMSYAGIVPSLIIPGILGVVFNLFPSRDEAYKVQRRALSSAHAAIRAGDDESALGPLSTLAAQFVQAACPKALTHTRTR